MFSLSFWIFNIYVMKLDNIFFFFLVYSIKSRNKYYNFLSSLIDTSLYLTKISYKCQCTLKLWEDSIHHFQTMFWLTPNQTASWYCLFTFEWAEIIIFLIILWNAGGSPTSCVHLGIFHSLTVVQSISVNGWLDTSLH